MSIDLKVTQPQRIPSGSSVLLMRALPQHVLTTPCFVLTQNVLSKLSASKELMKEILAREVKKQAEREADKAARAEAKVAAQAST